MSEDDVDMLAADGQGSGKVDRDRRAPRFSWTPAYEATFFRSLCESVQLGLRENSSFKAEAWERAAQALQESHGASPTKNHLINKSDNARKRFRLWRGLREDPDFVYNPKARTVTATEEAWRAHIEREPLSRALRGRPFDHEDYMETLYPDVIGSGGAPKRIMKPKRRDGQPGDESELAGPNMSVLSTEPAVTGQQSHLESPSNQRAQNASSGQPGTTTPSAAHTPAASIGSALTPPEDTAMLSKKRSLPSAEMNDSLPALNTPSRLETNQAGSPQKRTRFSAFEHAAPLAASASATLPAPQTIRDRDPGLLDTINGSLPGVQHVSCIGAGTGSGPWREKAVDLFYKDFSAEELDLQIHTFAINYTNITSSSGRISTFIESSHRRLKTPHITRFLSRYNLKESTVSAALQTKPIVQAIEGLLTASTVSYANAAAKGPKQSPSEAAAPPLPEVIPNESASTSSLIDVDMPSVHTVPSDFVEQDVKTETQANRIEREAEAAKAKAEHARKKAAAEAKKADSWITKQVSQLSDGAASGVALANLAAFVGVGSYLGYQGWNLYQRGNLDGKAVGLGVGILAAAGAAHAVVGSYLYRGKKN